MSRAIWKRYQKTPSSLWGQLSGWGEKSSYYYGLEDDRKSRIWLYRRKMINIAFSGVGGDNHII